MFNETKPFIGDSIPTSITYQRTTGITGADRAKIAADTRKIDIDVLGSQSPGPKLTESGDGQAVLVNLEVPANGNGNKAIDDLKAIRHVFGFAGVDPGTPLLVFIFLVALGIDYNIFLMTRVREETPRIGTRAAALKALAATGGVITSAGAVLAATFAVLALLPLTTFTEIGFAVAFGVLLDTLLVRSVIVPALTVDIGSPIWWPRRLARAEARPTPVLSTTGTIDR